MMGSPPAATVDHEVDGARFGVPDDPDAQAPGGCRGKAQARAIRGLRKYKTARSRDCRRNKRK
jgi:hypothetical protein